MINFGNVVTAMITPFNDDYSVDYDMAIELGHYLIENGTSTILLAGTTGESPTLTHDEELELFKRFSKEFNGKVNIMAGTGSNSTLTAIEATKMAQDVGVDASLQVVPYYNKPSQDGILKHFESIASATSIPLMLYNIPGRTGVNMDAQTIYKCSLIPSIVALKEAAGSVSQLKEIKSLVSDDFQLYSGDDGLTLDFMKEGAVGVVSVASHCVGLKINEMISMYKRGKIEEAEQINTFLEDLFDVLFISSNPAPVKYALSVMGFDVNSLRLPLIPISAENQAVVKHCLHSLSII